MATNTETADRFAALYARFPLRPIRSDEHCERACAFVAEVDRGVLTDDEQDYVDVLATLIEDYQRHRYRGVGPAPTQGGMLRFLIEDARGETVDQVAAATGIDPAALAAMVANERPIPVADVPTLARYFHVEPDVLMPGS